MNKYQRLKKQMSTDGGITWYDVIPYQYKKGSQIPDPEGDCTVITWEIVPGEYICTVSGDDEPTIQYRWVTVSGEYVCSGVDKYTKEKQQSSTDGITWTDTGNTRAGTLIEAYSSNCGYQTRWVTVQDDYVCLENAKYSKEKQQASYDYGVTWSDTGNVRQGTLIEAYSLDCGGYKARIYYCHRALNYSYTDYAYVPINGSSVLTFSEVNNAIERQEMKSIMNVTFTEEVTELGENCFKGAGLKSIVIPDYITVIGDGAFDGCGWMTNKPVIPDTVTSIGKNAFNNCHFSEFDIPSGISSISFGMLQYTYINTIDIPNNISTIGGNAFYGCEKLKTVTIPDTVTDIGGFAFYGCTSLESITINATTPPSQHGAFDNTNKCPIFVPAASVEAYKTAWPDYASRIYSSSGISKKGTLTYLNGDTYDIQLNDTMELLKTDIYRGINNSSDPHYYTKITGVVIESGIDTIGEYAFQNCSNITSMSIPNTVTTIKKYAFTHNEFTTVTIPSSVTRIDTEAFSNSGLVSITVPNSVTTLGVYVFSQCSDLETAVIGNGITSIGTRLFYNCEKLSNLTLPEGITSIDSGAFSGCKIESITLNSITQINSNAFYRCSSLKYVTLGSGLTRLYDSVFQYCTSLISITVKATTPPSMPANALYDTNNCIIYVPAESIDTYKTTGWWQNYASRIQAIPT